MSETGVAHNRFARGRGRLDPSVGKGSYTGFLLIVMASLFAVFPAGAQRLLAVTTTLSVMREAGRSYVQIVEMGYGRVEAMAVLPGTVVEKPPLVAPDGLTAVVSSGPPSTSQMAWDYLSRINLSRFGLSLMGASALGESGFLCALAGGSSPFVLRIGTGEKGFAEAWPLQGEATPLRGDLPETPVAAARIADTGRVAVLCRPSSNAGVVVRIVDGGDALRIIGEKFITNDRLFDAMPAGLAANTTGSCLFVLLTGHAVDRPSGEPLSWLHVLRILPDGPALPVEEDEAVEIPGAASGSEEALLAVGEASCWVATRTPGSGFAHAVRVTRCVGGLVKDIQVDLANVSKSLQIAPEPDGNRVAVAVDESLEIWCDGRRGEIRHTFDQTPAAVCWSCAGLFVGEGCFIHQINPDTAESVRSVALGSGWVKFMETLENPPPAPMETEPIPQLPGEILFRAETAGQAIKAFRVGSDTPRGTPWQVSFDRNELPWLVIHPVQGIAPGVVYMGVDPGLYTPERPGTGLLSVSIAHDARPHSVCLRVLPPARADVRRILWIWPDEAGGESFRDASDPRGLRRLGELLAAPPHLFAHREAVVPATEPLEAFTIVVLDAAAAMRGAVTRQALLDYVLHGGSLLFIGRYLPDADPAALASWLQPIQVEIDTHTAFGGIFPSTSDTRVGRHWRDVRMENGCAVYTGDPASIAVPVAGEARQAALIVRSYGRGRIAILAAPGPLTSTALMDAGNRRFAEDLFGWLARAGIDPFDQDMDGDSVPDAVEDKNGNGLVDPGETDYLDPDSDGDGVPDGLEDLNLNGMADEDETNPLNSDSNSNGIPDGADPAPLPGAGIPVVTGVSPVQCPAEGGLPAVVSGRNFPPDAAVWFGDSPARWVRILRGSGILVEVPPCVQPEGGDVSVRVRGESAGLEAVLPSAFHYTPLSRTAIILQGPVKAGKKEDTFHGEVGIHLDTPQQVTVGQVMLLLKAEPSEGLVWEAPAVTNAPDVRIVTRTTQTNDLLVAVLADKPGVALRGLLGTVAWRTAQPSGTIRFTINQPRVMSHTNRALGVASRPFTVTLP